MNGVVSAETPAITEAILEASPATLIVDVCEDQLSGSIFDGLAGGFVGGKLLNITTAIFAYMREEPGKPLVEKPVAYAAGANSFIGRLAMSLLNQSFESGNQGTAMPYTGKGFEHFCNKAEGFYAKEAIETTYPKGKPSTIMLSHGNDVVLYGKSEGESTALLVDRRGLTVNGIWLPPGVICDYEIKPGSKKVRHGDDVFVPIDSITGIQPYRISAFPIPHNEKVETFERPPGRIASGLATYKLWQYASIEFMRQSFNKKTSSLRLGPKPHEADSMLQVESELSLALS